MRQAFRLGPSVILPRFAYRLGGVEQQVQDRLAEQHRVDAPAAAGAMDVALDP